MINRRHLESLAMLRETGSLVRAAERLHLSQSALSHQFREIEERLGVVLFERKSRPPKFSVAGERLLVLADEVLPRLREAEREVAKIRDGQSGRLHIAVECHSCFDWLMPALESYRDHWPAVELDLAMGHAFDPLGALAAGEVDLVITADPVDHAMLSYHPLFSFQQVLVMPRDHPLRSRQWIEPADFTGQTLITYPVDSDRLDVYHRFLDPAGVTPQRRNIEMTLMILQLVASGRGVAALPQWVASDALAAGQVEARPLGRDGLWSSLHAAIRRTDRELAYLDAFVDGARSACFDELQGLRPVDTA